MRRFSKLKKRIESLFAPELELKVYCTVYAKKGNYDCMESPRLWIVLGKEIIFDWLKEFKEMKIDDPSYSEGRCVWYEDIVYITEMIQEYIETPRDELKEHSLYKDEYGLEERCKKMERDTPRFRR
jgi:hypothetical protein